MAVTGTATLSTGNSSTLFLHQTENLTREERQTLNELLAGPVGSELRMARTFLETWFDIWKDDTGQRH